MAEHQRSHIRKCNGPTCGKLVAWIQTAAEKWMCVDANADGKYPAADVVYDPKRHTNHWGTCPDREQFRRRPKGEGTEQEEGA